MITALELIKYQSKLIRDAFENTVGDITPEQLHIQPEGTAIALGPTYAHLIISEDRIVQGMIRSQSPLSDSTWKGKTGLDQPMPSFMDGDNWSIANITWSKAVKIDLDQLRQYAKAVFAATDEYFETLTEADLDREIDLGSWGPQSLYQVISSFIITHTAQLTGEIAVLKGLQGAKGYPF